MAEFYLDVETYSPTPKPNLREDKIIAIQFEKITTLDGNPEGELKILTEWECGSERDLLSKFREIFLTENPWGFVPVGVNLLFDLVSLLHRFNYHFKMDLGLDFFNTKPLVDIKSTLVMMNYGRMNRYQELLGKKHYGSEVREWYEKKQYDRILDYIREESENFITKYQVLKRELPNIKFTNRNTP